MALVPTAIAFRDSERGLIGARGTISTTGDGGRTWRVVARTPRPVVWVGYAGRVAWARLDNGETLRSGSSGATWRPAVPPRAPASPCPADLAVSVNQVVAARGGAMWALCAGQGGAGSMAKAVYRLGASGWRRVASTPLRAGHAFGGISAYGYPLGLAMAADGFGLIWESRGTLYVTRDGGSHWRGLPAVAPPEVAFGLSGAVLGGGAGFVLIRRGDVRVLLATSDGGGWWHAVHRWR